MEVPKPVFKYGALLLIGLICVGSVWAFFKKRAYDNQLVELQNQVAARDKTIEVSKGVYTKLTLQLTDLTSALDQKDEQVKGLEADLKKKKEDLLTASTVAIGWKKAYEAQVAGKQTDVPGVKPGDPTRVKVEFAKDFGYIGVDGFTLTNPAEATVKVKQNRPLKVTLAISQDKNKVWHTYTTSSEENVGVDIQLTGVNPTVLLPKWYENIGITTSLGIGTNASGLGAMLGFGLDYAFKQFALGPAIWLGLNDHVDKYYGINFTYRPFKKTP